MAKSKNNVVTHGLSGKVGDMLVFRQRAGKTIVGRVPVKSTVEPSSKQLLVQEKFHDGAVYAKSAIANPATKAFYEAGAADGQTAYNRALADYCVSPEIKLVDVTGYAGAIGDLILVKATDNFMVKSVKVTIEKLDGTLIEKGDAVQDASNGIKWLYTATTVNAVVTGIKVIATASDVPGNTTQKEEVIP